MRGKTIVDTTTNHFRDVLEFHRLVAAAGGSYLESPILDVLSAGAGNSLVLNAKREMLSRADFPPQFSCRAIAKDLAYLDDDGKSFGGRLSMGTAAADLYKSALDAGLGDLDFSSVVRIQNERLSPVNP